MVSVVCLSRTGGSDVLTLEDTVKQQLGSNEAWVEHDAIGVNYLDVMQRNGTAPVILPGTLGLEGAGRVLAVGAEVSNVSVGDRVAYMLGPIGSYASARAYPAARLVRLPDSVTADQAAAVMFKGITAQYLLKTTYPVGPGTVILLYGAAGALGKIMVPWAKHLGATVIGVVSHRDAIEYAKSAGCDAVLVWGTCEIAKEVAALTGGTKAHVVYDGVGRDTFNTSLDCLRVRGMLVSIGASSGSPPAVEVSTLNSKGSLYITRPSLAAHASDNAEYHQRAKEVLDAIADGIVSPSVWKSFPLAEVGKAHDALERGMSAGAVILKP